METFLEILQWTALVFAGGVIAGFGKLLASWIVKNRRKSLAITKKQGEGGETAPATGGGEGPVADDGERAKRDKKAEKDRKKREKKADKERRKKEKKETDKGPPDG